MTSRTDRHSHITMILLSVLVGSVLAGLVLYYPRTQVVANAQETVAPSTQAEALENTFVSVADRTLPAVVSINVETRGAAGNADDFEEFFKDMPFAEPFFRDRQQQQPRPQAQPRGMSLGSGWIYSDDGYIVTNSHVVRDADKITVKLHDKKNDDKEYTAKLVGTDPKTELAVIKIDAPRKLPTLSLGNSTNSRVGQWVMAVGAPFRLEQTVTVGVISAKGRFLPGQSRYIRIGDIIQTDASINPGNSGGPLVNLRGEVVGINVAIVSGGSTPGNVGIGFAIPSDTGARVIPELVTNKKVARGWLGVTIADLDDKDRDFWGVGDGGVLVEDISEDAPASKSELKVHDVIVGVNGEKVLETWDVQKAVAASKPGTEVALDVIRDRKPLKVTVKLGEMPGKYAGTAEEKPETKIEQITELSPLGVTVDELPEEIKEASGRSNGVIVTGAEADGPAAGKLLRGDIITQLNRSRVRNIAEFNEAMDAAKKAKDKYIMVFVTRRADGEWVKTHASIEPEW